MEVMYNTKGVMIMYPLPILFGIMLILVNGYCGGAAVLVESNTTFRCVGRLDECLLEDDLQLEFLMNPYVSRVLAKNPSPNPGINANTQGSQAIPPCKQDAPGYDACVARFKENHKPCDKRNIFAKCLP